jgi:serine/threonine protein kinase/tetratricopeptide (TPR) repeat protein
MKYCPQCTTGFPDHVDSCPTHNGMLSEIIDLKPGMLIRGTYRIVRKLGEGGFGAVYLAEQTLMDGELRTIKFLSRQWTRNEAFTARFRREVRALRQLRHKNIVDCGDLERAEDDSLFFSMEFVDGPDLRDFLHQAPPPFDVGLALSLVRGIAAGLEAAHARQMVHRDIKPDNILLMRDGDGWIPKIADFGIVATKESAAVHTMTGSSLLTMAYAAPEQWLGMRAAELDGRTDLYALGGVFYEMLTGRTVFEAESYEGWAREHLNAVPRPPSAVRHDLLQWRGLDALVIQLLAKDREDRPKDVAEMLTLLDTVKYVPPSQRQLTVPLSAVQRPPSLAAQPAATMHPATTVQPTATVRPSPTVQPGATVQRTVSDAAPAVQERETTTQQLTALQWFERGNTRFGRGDFEGAIKGYSEAIRLKPDYALAFNCQGSARFGIGDFEGAIEDYSEAIRLKPDYAVALTNRGNARCGQGDFAGAIEDYSEAIRLKPDYVVALTYRGNARCGQGDYEGAIKDCVEAIRLKPDYADAFNNRGNARKAKGDLEGALKDYREAIRLKPDYADAFNNRGTARFGTGDFEGAIKDYNEAIRLKPDYADAFNNRGDARKAKSDFGGAIKDYSEAIRLKPDNADAFTNRGNAHKAKGDLQGAIKDYSEVIRLKPGFAAAFNNRGSARLGTGDLDGAIKDYSEAIRLKPDYAVAFNNRGNARKAKGDFEGANEDRDEAIRLKSDPFKSRVVSTK